MVRANYLIWQIIQIHFSSFLGLDEKRRKPLLQRIYVKNIPYLHFF